VIRSRCRRIQRSVRKAGSHEEGSARVHDDLLGGFHWLCDGAGPGIGYRVGRYFYAISEVAKAADAAAVAAAAEINQRTFRDSGALVPTDKTWANAQSYVSQNTAGLSAKGVHAYVTGIEGEWWGEYGPGERVSADLSILFPSVVPNCTLNSAYPFAGSPITEHQILGDYLVYVLPIKLFELFIDNSGLLSYAKLRRIRALENDWGVFSQVFSNEIEFSEKAKNVKITFPDGKLLINSNP
jgi:hypothetical protein